MRTPRTLVAATANPKKLEEIRRVLGGLGVETVPLADAAPGTPEPDETGDTFEANAAIKALAYARAAGLPCLADDSGLIVDALGGAPGVRSARYAEGTPDWADARDRAARDGLNNRALLGALAGVPEERRSARFVCVLALGMPDGEIGLSCRGTLEGRIGTPPRVPSGGHGFGYDPLFLVGPGFERTSAELTPAEKDAISHRGRALSELASRLGG